MSVALVTGATGLVGSNLAMALVERGWTVRALCRPSSSTAVLADISHSVVIGDLLDSDSLRQAMAGCDVVFHVAGVSDHWRAGRERMLRVNVEGTRRVMASALATGVGRVVFTSSIAALGIPPRGHLLSEADQFDCQPKRFPYGHSKHLAEQEVWKAVGQGLDAVIVNPSAVLGPRDPHLGSASLLIEAQRWPIPFVPKGGLNLVDVADVAAGHIAAVERGRTGERYILGGENITHWELAHVVARTLGKSPPRWRLPDGIVRLGARLVDLIRFLLPHRIPITGETLRLATETFYVTHDKADRDLALPPPIPVAEMVARTHDWLRQAGHLP